MTKVSPVRRNQSAYNLKCLTAFYSLPHDVFCLALSTLDRFITKVKVSLYSRTYYLVTTLGRTFDFLPSLPKTTKKFTTDISFLFD